MATVLVFLLFDNQLPIEEHLIYIIVNCSISNFWHILNNIGCHKLLKYVIIIVDKYKFRVIGTYVCLSFNNNNFLLSMHIFI